MGKSLLNGFVQKPYGIGVMSLFPITVHGNNGSLDPSTYIYIYIWPKYNISPT